MSDWRYRASWRAFDLLLRPWMAHRFHAVRLAGLPEALPEGVPILLCPNHTSWWDGFLVRRLFHTLRPRATLLSIMLDEELGLNPILRPLGAIGIRRGSVASLRRTLRMLEAARHREPELGVLFFAQGRLWPSFRRPLGFQAGIRVFQEALTPVRLLPVGIHVEAGTAPAPVAYLSAGQLLEPTAADGSEDALRRLEMAVESEIDAIHHFLSLHGEDVEGRWPALHAPLPRAPEREGVPADDAWRTTW